MASTQTRERETPRFKFEEWDDEQVSQLMPTQLVALAEARAKSIQKLIEVLRVATIQCTLPEDWVRMGDFGYLQSKGCERVAPIWGLVHERTNLVDFEREDEPDGHVTWSVIVSGHSLRTGEERSEIGTRSTLSEWYRKRWDHEECTPEERRLMIYDARKAALTNAHGRLDRGLTGMGGVPIQRLAELAQFKIDQIPTVGFQKGGKGASARSDAPSDKQVYRICKLACQDKRVVGYGPKDLRPLIEKVTEAGVLTGKSASELIDLLDKAKTPMALKDFQERTGLGGTPTPAAEGAAPAGPDPKRACPECKRTPDHLADEGHHPECSLQGAAAPK